MLQSNFLETLEKKLLTLEEDLSHLSAEEQYERIMARVATRPNSVISPEDLLKQLKRSKDTGKPLKIKFGIDPTGPEIHIGHAISMINLSLFLRMGHELQIVVGDFTAKIGDPSGRSNERPPLTDEDIQKNMESYERQASRLIDFKHKRVTKHFNSEWMNKLTFSEWLELLKGISLSSMIQRDDFRKRLDKGLGVSLAEMEYGLFMGYDSIALKSDIEIGGIDQYLNFHCCRNMMNQAGLKPEVILTYDLLPGTSGEKDEDGRLVKMSKSKGNYIPLEADPKDMYGKVMSIPDDVMWVWYREITQISEDDCNKLKLLVESGELHPKDAKKLLARVVVATFNHYDPKVIEEAQKDFDSKFGKSSSLVPDNIVKVSFEAHEKMLDTLARILQESKGHVRRLVKQSGIRILKAEKYIPMTEEELEKDTSFFKGSLVKVGKIHFYEF